MKHILITGGPTNEAIDQVMKITNMSTGSLSCDLANRAVLCGCDVTLIVNEAVTKSAKFSGYGLGTNPHVLVVPVESTQDMYDALDAESNYEYDVIIHASAVGDYKPSFTFKIDDLAKELADAVDSSLGKDAQAEIFYKILQDPQSKVNDESKISSYESNLAVKLGLTTKLIKNLKQWFPGALLIGCKLLENVPHEELIEVATRLCKKNELDYVMANDLAEIREGHPVRYLVNQDGYTGITLNAEGGESLLDYAEKHWFE